MMSGCCLALCSEFFNRMFVFCFVFPNRPLGMQLPITTVHRYVLLGQPQGHYQTEEILTRHGGAVNHTCCYRAG